MDLSTPKLWAAQDALKTALQSEVSDASGTIPAVDLGAPANLEPNHIWVLGEAESVVEYEECSNAPSGEEVEIQVRLIATLAGTYEECRDRAQIYWGYVVSALTSAGFLATVDHARITEYKVETGMDGNGARQMGITLKVACSVWSG